MTAIGGSPRTVSINKREFPYTADSDINRSLGGHSNEILENGNNTVRVIQTAKKWKLENGAISCDDDRGDQEFLEDLISSGQLVTIIVTYAGNRVYSGLGQIEGDLDFANQTASIPCNFAGPGKLKKI